MSKLSIYPDKLSITINIPEPYQKEIHKKLKHLSDMRHFTKEIGFICEYIPYKKSEENKHRYNYHYNITHERPEIDVFSRITAGKTFSFNIQIEPKDKNSSPKKGRAQQNFMRLEFNPNNSMYAGTTQIYEFIEWLVGSKIAEKIYIDAKLTRLDLCVNTFHNIENLRPYHPKIRCVETFPKKGRRESEVFGSKHSDIKITLYNKTQENIARNRSIMHPYHFRLELQKRFFKTNMKAIDVADLKGQLSLIEFFDVQLIRNQNFEKAFIENVDAHGVHYALKELSDTQRRRYLRILRKKCSVNNVFNIYGVNEEKFLSILSAFQH